MKTCDNKSAGQIIHNNKGEIVLIERLNYPQSFALPAGHLDGDNFAECAEKETREEVGLTIERNTKVWAGEINNPCKRAGGSHHEWEVFAAVTWSGELKEGSDAKRAFWASEDALRKLAARTEYFLKKYSLDSSQVDEATLKIFGDPKAPTVDPEWSADPGLEPVWHFILTKLKVV